MRYWLTMAVDGTIRMDRALYCQEGASFRAPSRCGTALDCLNSDWSDPCRLVRQVNQLSGKDADAQRAVSEEDNHLQLASAAVGAEDLVKLADCPVSVRLPGNHPYGGKAVSIRAPPGIPVFF